MALAFHLLAKLEYDQKALYSCNDNADYCDDESI